MAGNETKSVKESVKNEKTNTKLFWVHALSPLHVGAGRGVGFIDLPIMREKVTGWPIIPGSAIKGVLRNYYEQESNGDEMKKKIETAFGKGSEDMANAGSIVFSDAKIVCLPVRSFYGTFAYITSPLVLRRLKKDLEIVEKNVPEVNDIPSRTAAVVKDSVLKGNDNKIILEELDLNANEEKDNNKLVSEWADVICNKLFSVQQWNDWKEIFKKRFAIVDDEVFNFLSITATEVNARIRIEDEKKVAAEGALWYEESLPVETILAGIVWCDRVYLPSKQENNAASSQSGQSSSSPDTLLKEFCSNERLLQIGGKATTGKGRIRLVFS